MPDDVVFQQHDVDDDKMRRQSYCSTIADLLDTYDSEDSELRNLEWDDLEGDDDPLPEDIYNYYQVLQGIEQLGQLPVHNPMSSDDRVEDEEVPNDGHVTVLDSNHYKTPIAEREQEENLSPFATNFNASAVPYSSSGPFINQSTQESSYQYSNEPSKKDAVQCLRRNISRAKSRHSGNNSQKSNYCSTNFQSPFQNPPSQNEIGSRSSTVMYKTPTTTKSYSTTNLESLADTENPAGEDFFSVAPSEFSVDNSFVFHNQSNPPNQPHFQIGQTPPLAISSPYHKREKRNSMNFGETYNHHYQRESADEPRKNSFSKNESKNSEVHASTKPKSIAQPVVTSDHSSLASLFSKSCGISQDEDSDAVSCSDTNYSSPKQYIDNSYSVPNDRLSHVNKNLNRMKNMSLENIQWDKGNEPSLHTNSNLAFGSGQTNGSLFVDSSNADMNRNRLANFWEKTVSNNTNDSNMILGQTQNLFKTIAKHDG